MHDFQKKIIFLGAIFVKSKHVQQFCESLHIFCTNFLRFGLDFHQMKTLGVQLHPLHLRLLHQWTKMKKLTAHVIQKQAPEKCTFHGW